MPKGVQNNPHSLFEPYKSYKEKRMNLFPYELAKVHRKMGHEAEIVKTIKWQGIDVSSKPEMAMHELRHVLLRAQMPSQDLEYYQTAIQPNLPWADDHFEERVCGYPINPGKEWANWPWGHSASSFLDKDGKFNHNYMERYWPKRAGYLGATATAEEFKARINTVDEPVRYGIYHAMGDLNDVVSLLVKEPTTRQAFFPVFFPEDTGAVHGSRLPCTIGYHFLMRNNRLDVEYIIRSCDFVRHFRDDIYLTVRLVLWVLEQCAKQDPQWKRVYPGEFVMLIGSLHCFRNDHLKLYGSGK